MRARFAMRLVGLLGAAMFAGASVRADVVYDETGGDPDLSGTYTMPTPINLNYGSNILTLVVSRDGTTFQLDLDLFRIELPLGARLSNVILTDASANANRSFIAFQEGFSWSFDMDESTGDPAICLDECAGLGHFGLGVFGASVGDDLLNAMNVQSPQYSIPLSGSQYVFWVQELEIDPTQFSFDFVTTIPGDYNGDNFVNAADYTVWRNTLGQNVPEGSGADGDRDSTVDLDDYLVWKETYGLMVNTGGGSSADAGGQVPEPNALAITLVAAVVFVATCGRQGMTGRRLQP